MRVILFGASGMVGQAVLRECLLSPDVEAVLTVVRRASGPSDPKVQELVHADFTDFTSVEAQLTGYDACVFALGVSSAGMSEADYTRVTYDFTVAAARSIAKVNPALTFVFVSGANTDRTSKRMWARVKARAEDALLAMPFKAAYMLRPAFIKPQHGIRSRTRAYRLGYVVMWPFAWLIVRFPSVATTTDKLGRAALRLVREGYSKPIIESRDINVLGEESPRSLAR